MDRRALIIATMVFSAAGAAGACARATPGNTASQAVSVTVQAARVDTIRATFTGPGTVAPSSAADWTIYAPESGRIAELPKKEGDAVKAGDLLVRFDIADVSQDLAARQLDVTTAAARVETANAELTRKSSLYDRGITSRNDFEAAKTAVATAESALTHATALLAASTTLADRAVVKARFAGVVAKRWHNEGDVITAGVSDPVLRVIDPTRLEVVVQVPVAEVARVTPGEPVTILAAAGPVGTPGVVLTLPAAFPPQATTVDVRVSFAAGTTLTLGVPVQVEILLDERTNVVVVPAASLARTEGATYVMIASADGLAHRRDVRLGLVTKDWAEVVSGVAAGDRCIVGGLDDVVDGGPVTIGR